jgi:hypothetical protein
MAQWRIDQAAYRYTQQAQRIERMRAAGQDVSEAERLLEDLEDSLDLLRHHLKVLVAIRAQDEGVVSEVGSRA